MRERRGEKEREREGGRKREKEGDGEAAVVPLRESRMAIVIAVTCAMHGEKYRRLVKVPPILAESFLHGSKSQSDKYTGCRLKRENR